MIPKLLDLLKKCNILFESENFINGMIIPREILLSKDKFIQLTNEIMEIKKNFSSSRLTSLQKTAKDNQKWPLLNLVRQILKTNDYKMTPKRKSNGYDEDGKKKYLRFFFIDKISTEEIKDISASIVE